MVKTMGLTHLALTVRDLNRSFQFYHDVFGMLAIYREPNFIEAQTPGREDILVLEKAEEERQAEVDRTHDIGKSGGIAWTSAIRSIPPCPGNSRSARAVCRSPSVVVGRSAGASQSCQ